MYATSVGSESMTESAKDSILIETETKCSTAPRVMTSSSVDCKYDNDMMLSYNMSCHVMSCLVLCCQVKSSQVKSNQITRCHVMRRNRCNENRITIITNKVKNKVELKIYWLFNQNLNPPNIIE